MMATRLGAVSAIVLGIAATFPAASSAAPVDPAKAILSAAEFPIDTGASYRVTHAVQPSPTKSSGLTENACEAASARMLAAVSGARSTEAMGFQNKTYASVELTDRALLAPIRSVVDACNSSQQDALTLVATPAEFARYGLIAGTASGGEELNGWAEVRGTTIQVVVDAGPQRADYRTFWQLFRSQIAKIEKQP